MPLKPPVFRPTHLGLKRERQHQLKRLDQRRGSSASRGYDADWRRVRLIALAAEPLCRFCAERGLTVPGEEVDHIKPLDLRPDLRLVLSNLRTLCKRCHSRLTASGVQRRGMSASHE
jgi:5-methylcytosine-specific restriction protein A